MASVADLMSRTLVTLETGATIGDAVTLMAQRKVGSVLILDGGRLAGIFTERDVVRALSTSHEATGEGVDGWMTANPTTVAPEETVAGALEQMERGGFRHLPVMERGLLVGMVSIRDLAHA